MKASIIITSLGFCLSAQAAFEAPLSLERGLILSEPHTKEKPEPKLEKQESKSVPKSDRTRLNSRRSDHRSWADLQAQALRVFEFLNADQKVQAVYEFSHPSREKWRSRAAPRGLARAFLPSSPGISIMDLSPDQRLQLSRLLDQALSTQGLRVVQSAVESDRDFAEQGARFWERWIYQYGPENFYFAFYGSPRDPQWGWKFEGHGVSINFEQNSRGETKISPLFLGTTRGQVQLAQGLRVEPLRPLNQKIEEFLKSWSRTNGFQGGLSSQSAPSSLAFAPGLWGGARQSSSSEGESYQSLTPASKRLIQQILQSYLGHLEEPLRRKELERVRRGRSSLRVVGAGLETPTSPFYLRLESGTFVFEYLNQDPQQGQIHALWLHRD